MEAIARLTAALAGRYSVEREIGRGGSATVYLASDLKHDRKVALKVLRPELAVHLGTERFLAEIRLTANLQHPHILPLFDSGEVDGLLFFVMPHVAGETLRERLEREGRLSLDEALRIFDAVAGALEYAHRLGILHRDLKPENILFQERVPLLADFGIARAVTRAGGERLTKTGLFVGTPLYASPEQATGTGLGPGSDVYSLAAVLYEMLAGEPPFTGPTVEAVIARSLLEPPRPLRTVRQGLPPGVEGAILKALAKLPSERYGTVAEFGDAIRKPARAAFAENGARPLWKRAAKPALSVVALALLALTANAIVGSSESLPSTRQQLTFSGNVSAATISPDGDFLAYTVLDSADMPTVVVQDLAGGPPDSLISLPGIAAHEWSPDGTRLLITGYDGSADGSAGTAAIVFRTGGQPRLLPLARRYLWVRGRWMPDGEHISLVTDDLPHRLLTVELATGDTMPVPIAGDHDGINWWDWSPDGSRVAVGLRWSSPIRSELRVVFPDGRFETIVSDTGLVGAVRWSPDGSAVYYCRGPESIWRIDVSPRSGRPRGDPIEVEAALDGLQVDGYGGCDFALTRDGERLVYVSGRRFSNLYVVQREPGGTVGSTTALTTGTALRWGAAISPDSRWIAFSQQAADEVDIYRMPSSGGSATRVTFGSGVLVDSDLAWSSDGRRLAFVSVHDGEGQLRLADVQTGAVTPLTLSGASSTFGNLAWHPGPGIAFLAEGHQAIHLLDLERDDTTIILPRNANDYVFSPRYSPDGRSVAFLRNTDGGRQDLGGVWMVDVRTGAETKLTSRFSLLPSGWSGDGRFLYVRSWPGSTLYRIDVAGPLPAEPEEFLRPPFREADCEPSRAGSQDSEFLCTASNFQADVAMITGFDEE